MYYYCLGTYKKNVCKDPNFKAKSGSFKTDWMLYTHLKRTKDYRGIHLFLTLLIFD